jgi:hypothetical protein
MIVLQRFECKPNVRHGAPAAQQTGTPPAKKCTPAVNCGMLTCSLSSNGVTAAT